MSQPPHLPPLLSHSPLLPSLSVPPSTDDFLLSLKTTTVPLPGLSSSLVLHPPPSTSAPLTSILSPYRFPPLRPSTTSSTSMDTITDPRTHPYYTIPAHPLALLELIAHLDADVAHEVQRVRTRIGAARALVGTLAEERRARCEAAARRKPAGSPDN